jgi:hypothetical protein
MAKKDSHLVIDEEEEARKKLKELESKFKRLDGKALTEKQKQELLKKEMDAKKKEEDFDPRKHRLKHGIRNYDKSQGASAFEGKKGIKLN